MQQLSCALWGVGVGAQQNCRLVGARHSFGATLVICSLQDMFPVSLLVAWAAAWACSLLAGRLAAARKLPESLDIDLEWWRVTISVDSDSG